MFRLRILDRYILREIVTPFFLSIAALTLVLFLQKMYRLAELVVSKGATVWSTVKVLGYIMPGFLVLTIPMSFLVATLTAFTRLCTDSEVTAMASASVSTNDPAGYAGVATFIVAPLCLLIAPKSNHALKVHLSTW
jgi:lipopolysaccharide export system permease protein